jgi:hypothetical protein
VKLRIVGSNDLCGFGDNPRKIINEDDGETLAYISTIQERGLPPEIWVHFPKPLKKKKAKAVMEMLEVWKN